MPRKAKKSVDLLASLEILANDKNMSDAIRAEAAKEYLRLKLKDQRPAPAPAPATRVDDMSVDTFVAAVKQFEQELKAKSEPVPDKPEPEKLRVKELTESQAFAIDTPERERRTKAAKDERERVERVRQAEASRPETIEEFQQRRQGEMRRARQEWAQAMGCPVQPEWPGV